LEGQITSHHCEEQKLPEKRLAGKSLKDWHLPKHDLLLLLLLMTEIYYDNPVSQLKCCNYMKQTAIKNNVHSKGNNTDDNKYIVAAEMVNVFHQSSATRCQSLRHHKFTSIKKISPWLHTIAPSVNELLQLHIGEC